MLICFQEVFFPLRSRSWASCSFVKVGGGVGSPAAAAGAAGVAGSAGAAGATGVGVAGVAAEGAGFGVGEEVVGVVGFCEGMLAQEVRSGGKAAVGKQ